MGAHAELNEFEAAVAEVQETETRRGFEFNGKFFRLARKVGIMPLLSFANMAVKGMSTEDIGAMSAMYDVLWSLVDPEDWDEFVKHATATRASDDEILDAIKNTLPMVSGRPTERPSSSTPPESSTGERSKVATLRRTPPAGFTPVGQALRSST